MAQVHKASALQAGTISYRKTRLVNASPACSANDAEPALADIERIYAWVEPHGERSAARLVSSRRDRAESLASLPLQGRPGRVEGNRELILAGTDYLILYRLGADAVELLRIVYTRQKRPPKL